MGKQRPLRAELRLPSASLELRTEPGRAQARGRGPRADRCVRVCVCGARWRRSRSGCSGFRVAPGDPRGRCTRRRAGSGCIQQMLIDPGAGRKPDASQCEAASGSARVRPSTPVVTETLSAPSRGQARAHLPQQPISCGLPSRSAAAGPTSCCRSPKRTTGGCGNQFRSPW